MEKSNQKQKNNFMKNFKEKKTLYFTNEYAGEILQFTLAFAFVHFIFLVLFLFEHVTEMFVYNIFSVFLFLTIGLLIFFKRNINLTFLDILISCEVVLHQILAIRFVGLDAGFQYLILGITVPIVYYTLNDIFIVVSIVKTVLALVLFFTCDFLFKYYFTPVYQITNENWLNFAYYSCIFCLFISVAKGTIVSYSKYKEKLKKEYQFHKDAIDKQMNMQQNIIQTISDIVEARDETTGQHTERTKEYVFQILNKLKTYDDFKDVLTEKYIQEVSSAAVLHDIGKIKIPDAILRKPARLTDEEYEVIKTHTIEGSNLLDVCYKSIDNESYYKIAKNIALYHHERWDGNGYPEKLSKKEIPLEARIMAVADVYDALMSKRPYKEKFDKNTALKIMKEGRGTQFDPIVLDCFVDYIENVL